jgi:hypothetical protein
MPDDSLAARAADRELFQPIEFPQPTLADILNQYGRTGIDVDEIEHLIADCSGRSAAHAEAWLYFFLAWANACRSVVSKEIRRLAASDGIDRAPVIIPLTHYDYDNDKVIDDGRGGKVQLVWEGDRLALAFRGTAIVADCYDAADEGCERFHLPRVSPLGRAADWDDPAVAAACLDNLADWAEKRLAELERLDGPPKSLNQSQREIWLVLKESKRPMRMREIEAELEQRDGAAPSQGMLKHHLAEMTRQAVLTNPSRGRGYEIAGAKLAPS